MIEKVFNNGKVNDTRNILIKIDSEFILFYFKEYYDRQNRWIREEEDRRNGCGEEELTEDEKANNEFYWIGIDDWKIPQRNFPEHMMEKMWFTGEMLDFINDTVYGK